MKVSCTLNEAGIPSYVFTHLGIRCRIGCKFVLGLVLGTAASASAHAGPTANAGDAFPDAPQAQSDVKIRAMPENILHDQKTIWTSPFHIRTKDLKIVVPLLLGTGVAIATDKHTLQEVVSLDPAFNDKNTNASNVLMGGFLAAPVVLYGVGHFAGNEHARETGLLGAEAMLDGVVVEQGMKLIFWRERPDQDMGHGHFFQSSAGWDSSFPSSHSLLAWSAAAVIAGEYPNPFTQVLVYTGAAGISFTRIMGQQHFPADVLVGSAAGWLVGHYVYKHRHHYHATHTDHRPTSR